jgi:asparagine synthase (glutamine-hydrolysing)
MFASGVAIAINGEIYNHHALRAQLPHYRFRSKSDSEIVLAGYLEWGLEKLLERLDGIYAALIYDSNKHQVHLFRDRIGVKPLYYSLTNSQLLVSSELSPLRKALPDSTLDLEALFDFYTYRYIPSPKTHLKNIRKLRQGHSLTVALDAPQDSPRPYYSLLARIQPTHRTRSASEMAAAIEESVCDQLMSDVPIAVFLSGGLDSSIVAKLACAHLPSPPDLFTISFPGDPRDERTQAEAYAAALGAPLHVVSMERAQQVPKPDDWLLSMFGEPFADSSSFPTAYLCEFVARTHKVALSGDGGDELFGGYRWYERFHHWRRWWRHWPLKGSRYPRFSRPPVNIIEKSLNRLALLASRDELDLYLALLPRPTISERRIIRSELGVPKDYDELWHFRAHYHPELGATRSLMYLDFMTFLPDDVLVKVDRTSMRSGLEVRVPLLGTKVAEMALSSSEEVLLGRERERKHLLRLAFPDVVAAKPGHLSKQGFSAPSYLWDSAAENRETLQMKVLRGVLGLERSQ